MLILSRRSGESIIVGDEVTVTVLSVKGKQVRIGIDAPTHIGVHREEIYLRIKEDSSEESSYESTDPGTDHPGTEPGNKPGSEPDSENERSEVTQQSKTNQKSPPVD